MYSNPHPCVACDENAKDKPSNDNSNESNDLIDINNVSPPAAKREKIVVNEIDTTMINANESETVSSFADSTQSNNSPINCDDILASVDGIESNSMVPGITMPSFRSTVSTPHVANDDDTKKGYDTASQDDADKEHFYFYQDMKPLGTSLIEEIPQSISNEIRKFKVVD